MCAFVELVSVLLQGPNPKFGGFRSLTYKKEHIGVSFRSHAPSKTPQEALLLKLSGSQGISLRTAS